MKMASYMLGHLDGLGDEASLQQISDDISQTFFHGYLDRLSIALKAIWSGREGWSSKDEFLEIGNITLDLIRNRGVEIKPVEGGAFVRLVDVSMYV
jgi:hypothetical protein